MHMLPGQREAVAVPSSARDLQYFTATSVSQGLVHLRKSTSELFSAAPRADQLPCWDTAKVTQFQTFIKTIFIPKAELFSSKRVARITLSTSTDKTLGRNFHLSF